MDRWDKKGMMAALTAHGALLVALVVGFLSGGASAPEPTPVVEVSIAGLPPGAATTAPDAEPDAGASGDDLDELPPPLSEEELAAEALADKAADRAAADRAASDSAAAEAEAAADEARRKQAEAADAAKREAAARTEAERKKAAEETARRKSEAEAAARKKREAAEAARKKREAEEAARKKRAAEEAARKKAEAEARDRAKSLSDRLGGVGSGNSGSDSGGGSAGHTAAEARSAANASIAGEVRPYLRACAPSGVGVSDLRIFVQLSIGRSGDLLNASVYDVQGENANNRSQVEPMKRCALQALSKASPFDLDAADYDIWKSHKVQLKPN